MGGSRDPGSMGRSGQAQDLNDGTMIRGLSPRPGAVGISSTTAFGRLEDVDLDASGVNRLLQRLLDAGSGEELRRIAVALLGPQCFSAGVIAGIGVDVFNSAKDLAKLVGTFVLADLHDLKTGETSWWRYADPTTAPRLISARLAGVFFGGELRRAAEERDAIIKELSDALQAPKAFFEGLADGVAEGYKKDWQEFNRHMNSGTLEGQFRAGMIFGRLLVDVLGLLTGVAGIAKAGAKVASKLPQLVKYARSVKLKPGIRKGSSGGGARGGGNGAPKAPPKQVTAKPQSGSRTEAPESGSRKEPASGSKPARRVPPGHTEPTGTPGGKPTGKPKKIRPQDDAETKRSLQRENESAEKLADAGYKVEQLPEVKGKNNPDYRIEGKHFDCKAPSTNKPRNAASEIEKSVNKGQADRIVLNLEDSPITPEVMKKQLNDYPIGGLKEVIVIKNGQVIPLWP